MMYWNDHPVRAVNHRGFNKEAPENTISAYRLSKQKGFLFVECDVSFTADNMPVLLHDDTVNRTSNGKGKISEMTFEEVRRLDFGSWFSDKYIGEKIPTFEEFISFCRNAGLYPYIELKKGLTAERAEMLMGLVKRYGMFGKVTWISFFAESLAYIRALDNKARLGFLTERLSEKDVLVAESDRMALYVNPKDMNLIVEDKATGTKWYAVDPDGKESEMALISVNYVGEDNTFYNWDSYTYCTANYTEDAETPAYRLYRIENGVRIAMHINEGASQKFFEYMPHKMSVEHYENIFLATIER